MKHETNIPEAVPFQFSAKLKKILGGFALLGIVALIWAIFLSDLSTERIWANVWLNSLLFLFMGLGALFFWTVHNLGESGWQTSIQRVPEAMAKTIPVAAILLLLALPGVKDIFEWANADHHDHLLELKSGYLNFPFWMVRFVIYFAGWTLFANRLRKLSLASDFDPEGNYLKKLRSTSGWFMVFFAVTSSMSAWDWLMSIDAHWFSTIYGWYTFSGMFVVAVAAIIIIVSGMKHFNIMPHVRDEHLHDLGKYLFGFSIFWAYLWISQFLLIWYANIPEETIYFQERLNHFFPLFYINVGVNFLFPFLALMTRGSKRQPLYLSIIALVLIAGHWIDLYLAIMPGAVGYEKAGIGFLEIVLPFFYLALFLAVFFVQFGKAKVVPENHPYFKESFDYENI